VDQDVQGAMEHAEEEATWERKEELKKEFPCFFSNPSESQG
jgi:hypothetical protein